MSYDYLWLPFVSSDSFSVISFLMDYSLLGSCSWSPLIIEKSISVLFSIYFFDERLVKVNDEFVKIQSAYMRSVLGQ